MPVLNTRALDVVIASGLFSRREIKGVRGGLRFVGTPPVPLRERVTVGPEWTPAVFGGRKFSVRVSVPPLVLVDKPLGVVTSRTPETGAPTVFDALEPELHTRVEPVGRLDRDTEGLLLMTGDGALIQWLTHPRRAFPRSYVAHVTGSPDPSILEAIRLGTFALHDGYAPHPDRLEQMSSEPTSNEPLAEVLASGITAWRVVLTSGKYHEVRRIFGATGARVTALWRDGYAGFVRSDLKGEPVRRLTDAEVGEAYSRLGIRAPEPVLETRIEGA